MWLNLKSGNKSWGGLGNSRENERGVIWVLQAALGGEAEIVLRWYDKNNEIVD